MSAVVRQRDTTWASFKSRFDNSQLRSPLGRQEARLCGGSGLQSSVAHAPRSWHPRLTRSPSFYAAPTPAAAPSGWATTVILQRVSCRTRDPATPGPGNQLKPPGAGVDTQNNPRLLYGGFYTVPCRALTIQPDCWCRQVDMPKAAGSSYRGNNTT